MIGAKVGSAAEIKNFKVALSTILSANNFCRTGKRLLFGKFVLSTIIKTVI